MILIYEHVDTLGASGVRFSRNPTLIVGVPLCSIGPEPITVSLLVSSYPGDMMLDCWEHYGWLMECAITLTQL